MKSLLFFTGRIHKPTSISPKRVKYINKAKIAKKHKNPGSEATQTFSKAKIKGSDRLNQTATINPYLDVFLTLT